MCVFETQEKTDPGNTGRFLLSYAMIANTEPLKQMEKRGPFLALSMWTLHGMTEKILWKSVWGGEG